MRVERAVKPKHKFRWLRRSLSTTQESAHCSKLYWGFQKVQNASMGVFVPCNVVWKIEQIARTQNRTKRWLWLSLTTVVVAWFYYFTRTHNAYVCTRTLTYHSTSHSKRIQGHTKLPYIPPHHNHSLVFGSQQSIANGWIQNKSQNGENKRD